MITPVLQMRSPKPCHRHRIRGVRVKSQTHISLTPKPEESASSSAFPTYLPGPLPTLGPRHCSPAPCREEIRDEACKVQSGSFPASSPGRTEKPLAEFQLHNLTTTATWPPPASGSPNQGIGNFTNT